MPSYYVEMFRSGDGIATRSTYRRGLSLEAAQAIADRYARKGARLGMYKPGMPVLECLEVAAHCRRMRLKECAREWIAKARDWRVNRASIDEADREWVQQNRAFAESRFVDVAGFLGERRPQWCREAWGVRCGNFPHDYRRAVVKVDHGGPLA